MPAATSRARRLANVARMIQVAVREKDATEAASLLRAMNVVDARFHFDLNSGALCLQVQGTVPVPTGVLHSVDYAERLDGSTRTVIKLRDPEHLTAFTGDLPPVPTCWDHLMDDGS